MYHDTVLSPALVCMLDSAFERAQGVFPRVQPCMKGVICLSSKTVFSMASCISDVTAEKLSICLTCSIVLTERSWQAVHTASSEHEG